ncbi:glycine cleavage system protein GcvH [Streptomyces sp. NPDC051920]|uniref:glycine cleavage system protein GcvH n=1 Tax=Streptomyces sp. NPDC051920 TaxID=3155523 RepID=UPI00342FC00E
MSTVPKDLKYTDDHEWARVEADGTVTVGITDHAQKQLGDVVFVDLPMVGKKVEAGDVVGMIESVKVATDLFAPVSGELTVANQDALDNPDELNDDPYGLWLFRIKPGEGDSAANLLSAAQYTKLISG